MADQTSELSRYILGKNKKKRGQDTWDGKRDEKTIKDSRVLWEKSKRTDVLIGIRQNVSLAKGVAAYRNSIGFSRTQFAKALGITRRALFNYETGTRAVPGDLLEKIVRRGDVELNEIFGTSPEPVSSSEKLELSRLSIDLFIACVNYLPEAKIVDVRAKVDRAVADWPRGVLHSEKNIQKVAEREMLELSFWYDEVWYAEKCKTEDKL